MLVALSGKPLAECVVEGEIWHGGVFIVSEENPKCGFPHQHAGYHR